MFERDRVLYEWYRQMQAATDYLPPFLMQASMTYSIWARNACVGIWLPEKRGFLLSRYKFDPEPYLFVEYHWDIGEPLGTAKPLRPITPCPLPLPVAPPYRDFAGGAALCAWLDALEMANPPVPGVDSVAERRNAVPRPAGGEGK